jgi:hypothetical protein
MRPVQEQIPATPPGHGWQLLPYQATFARLGRQPVARDHRRLGTCVAFNRESRLPAL